MDGRLKDAAPEGPTITAPAAGQKFGIGSAKNVKWTHNLGADESVRVEVSRDGGATWGNIKDIVVRDHGTWTDQKGNQHVWSWTLSNPSLMFVNIVPWSISPARSAWRAPTRGANRPGRSGSAGTGACTACATARTCPCACATH